MLPTVEFGMRNSPGPFLPGYLCFQITGSGVNRQSKLVGRQSAALRNLQIVSLSIRISEFFSSVRTPCRKSLNKASDNTSHRFVASCRAGSEPHRVLKVSRQFFLATRLTGMIQPKKSKFRTTIVNPVSD